MEEIVKQLSKGNDFLIRERSTLAIRKILEASERGDIGFGEYIEQVRIIIDGMESICKYHYKQ